MSKRKNDRRFFHMPDTLVKRCVCSICLVAMIMLGVVSFGLENWMYSFLKPQLYHNMSVLTSAVSTKISYLLHQNTQYLLKFWQDEELMEKVETYADGLKMEEEGGRRLKEEIVEGLADEKLGSTEPGAIISTRQAFLVIDRENFVGKEELREQARLVMESEWYEQLPETLTILSENFEGQLPRCYTPVFSSDDGQMEFIAYVMLKNLGGHECLIFMTEPFEEFRNLFQDFLSADIQDFALVGFDENILFTNLKDSGFIELEKDQIAEAFPEEQYTQKQQGDDEHTVVGMRLSYRIEDLKLLVCLKKGDVLRPYESFLHLINILFICFTVILVLIIIFILSRALSRVKQLAKQMREVQNGSYQVPRRIQGKDEVGMLADTFYQMMDEIQANVQQIREQEEKEQHIEYSLLVSQINPHFIYNTLNTITYLAQMNRTKDIMEINKALIGMLRDRLRISRLQIFDVVEKEKQQVYAYITIQNYLCSNEIQLDFQVSQECENIQYPKNVLQPFVENSILHGILLHRDEEERLIPGKIRIRITVEGEEILTEICDNGTGMEDALIQRYFYAETKHAAGVLDEDNDREHIGILNIRMRMEYLYGNAFRLEAGNLPQGGLKILFWIPKRML